MVIKGIWYFDKKYSELIYRPIGIAPVAVSLDEEEPVGGGDDGLVDDPRILEPDGEDSDGDGISDFDEVESFGTDPQLADTDGDGLNDGFETNIGTDPLEGDPEHKQRFEGLVSDFKASQEKTIVTDDSEKETIVPLFWVYYPHAREILKKGQAFNNEILQSIFLLMILLIQEDLALLSIKKKTFMKTEKLKIILRIIFMRLQSLKELKKNKKLRA